MRTSLAPQPLSHHLSQLYEVPYARTSRWGWRGSSLGERGCLMQGMRTQVEIQDSCKNLNVPIPPELWRRRQGDCGDLLAPNLAPGPVRDPEKKGTEMATGCPPPPQVCILLEAPTQPCMIYRAPFLSFSLQIPPGSESPLIRNLISPPLPE